MTDREPIGQDAYAYSAPNGFRNIHPTRFAVEMCGTGAVVPVRITPDPKGRYWCWQDTHGELSMVWPSRTLLEMCFPYGIQFSADRGDGQVVRARVEYRGAS